MIEHVFEAMSGAGGGGGGVMRVLSAPDAPVSDRTRVLGGGRPDGVRGRGGVPALDEVTGLATALADDVADEGWWADEPEPLLDDVPPEAQHAPWESLAGIEDVPPDGMLALVLEEVDITAVDDRLLVETIAGWQRIAAWAELNAALGAAELSRRESMNPAWNAPAPANGNVAGDELAMRLAWSRRAAERLVRDGRALDELLATAEAVRQGRIDGARMRVLTDRLHDRPAELAWAVQEQVLPGAATRTPRQLADDVDRALLEVEPLDAADRLARAVAGRHVCHPKRLPDGMAGIWAVLPADRAVRIDTVLEATARTARTSGDPRTLDQLRADILVELATGQVLPAGTGAGVAPVDDVPPAAGSGTGGAPRVVGRSGPGQMPIRLPLVRIDVTVALSTLMGLDEKPANLAGFGPISADQARALAAGGVWRRLVTDPLTGAVLDVGRTRYRPPRALAEHVLARDAVCSAPGCSVPASRCDLDHTDEYHGRAANGARSPGATAAGNLGPLSDRCHRIKTDGGFTLTQPEPGVFEWRTPAGLAYRVVPGDRGRAERLGAGPRSGYPDEPPF